MAKSYKVVLVHEDGRILDKGEIYIGPRTKRWEWFNERRGKEAFPKGYTAQQVRAYIAKLCRADVTNIKLI